MGSKLAIVIPAYKDLYFAATLDSLVRQTCKDFVVYVGDDCSPYDIKGVVENYRKDLNIVYKRFVENLGAEDLVAQWERCIALSKQEPYIWLFSDDDVLEPNCVNELLDAIEDTNGEYDVYHFDINEINEAGDIIRRRKSYPNVIKGFDFYKGKLSGKYASYVVENIFSRKIYNSVGGFLKFDLAWGSDTATWILFSSEKGIYRIPNSRVCWRRSKQNITPNKEEKIAKRKLMADCQFLQWSYNYFENEPQIYLINRTTFVNKIYSYKRFVDQTIINHAITIFFQTHHHQRDLIILKHILCCPPLVFKWVHRAWRYMLKAKLFLRIKK